MKGKNLLKAMMVGGLGLFTYDWLYRFLFPLHQSYPASKPLSQSSQGPLTIDFVSEDQYAQVMDQDIIPILESLKHSSTIKHNGLLLHYDFYIVNPNFPTVIILHGFNEFKEKFREIAYYFTQWNYNVLIYDQRGHGFSRNNPRDKVVNIEDFQTYILDLEKIIDHIQEEFPIKQEYILLGHSMGGAIALSYVHDRPDQISKIILSSPMMNIDTSPLSRAMVYLFTSAAKLINLEGYRIPFQAAKGLGVHSYYTPNPGLTRSLARNHYAYELNKRIHEIPTQGGTLRWLRAAVIQLRVMSQSQYLREIDIPILAFISQTDRIVRNDGLFHAGHYLPQLKLITVAEAGHELYQEQDPILKNYLSVIEAFLKNK